jgi:hypothetical protein
VPENRWEIFVNFTSTRISSAQAACGTSLGVVALKRNNRLAWQEKIDMLFARRDCVVRLFWHQFYGDCSGNITANRTVLL